MREDYSWNAVFNFVMEVKDAYFNKFGKVEYYNTYDLTTLEFWVKKLDINEYIERIKPLQINQDQDLILLRYGNYSKSFDGEKDVSMFDPIFWSLFGGFYKECRSIVIDIKNEEIVICPFKKFNNLDEIEETKLENVIARINNCNHFEVSEKLDGSMQCANFYRGNIIYTGAQGLSEDKSWRIKDGKRMLQDERYEKMIRDNPNWTFIFEYISLRDAHVVIYTKEQEGLYLIGIRDKYSGELLSYEEILNIAKIYNITNHIQLYRQTLKEVLNDLDKYKSNEREGVVLYIDGFQVKIKYNDYVKIHKILSLISSPNIIIESIADNWFDDLISKVPDAYRHKIINIAKEINTYVINKEEKINEYFIQAKNNTSNKKEFMVWTNANVPKMYRCYVINKFLNKPYNLLKSRVGRYYKMSDLSLRKDENNEDNES